MTKRVLVTVGTTAFDKLLETLISDQVQSILNTASIIYQIGRGETTIFSPDDELKNDGREAWKEVAPSQRKWIRLSRDMPGLMSGATHMICHGGAGSIIEGLQSHLPILAISNPALMQNHQEELCEALFKRGDILSLSGSKLDADTLAEEVKKLLEFSPSATSASFFDECVAAFERTVIVATGDQTLFRDPQ